MKKRKILALLLAMTLLTGITITSCSKSDAKKDNNSKKHSSEVDDEDDKDDSKGKSDTEKESKEDDGTDDIDQEATNTQQPKTCEEAMDEYMQYLLNDDYATAASLTHENLYNINTLYTHLDDEQGEIAKLLITTSTYTVSDFGYDEDEASCYLNLTYKDYETFYDRYRDAHIKWTFEDFMNELNKVDYTTTEEINFELIQEDEGWVIISDIELWDFLYDMLEPFEVPDVYEYIPKEFSELLNKSFESENVISMLKNSEMRNSIYPMLKFEEGQDQFIEKYVEYISYEWNLVSVDKESETAVFKVTTLIPDITALTESIYNDADYLRQFNVVSFAYTYAGEDRFDEGLKVMDNMKIDKSIAELANCSMKSKTIELTMTFEDIENSKLPEEFCDCLFFELTGDLQINSIEADFVAIKIEALDYALSHGLIDQAQRDAYYLEIINNTELVEEVEPTEEVEAAEILRVESDVFYADTSILGMTFDNANALFGNTFPAPQVWEWGTYDSFFDYNYNGNQYTFFLINNIVAAVRYEIVFDDIPENTLNAYGNMYGSSRILCDEFGNHILRGNQGAGFRFFTDNGYIDVFMNIYDDITHIAMHYSL